MFISHDEMGVVRLHGVLLAMASKVHPGVIFQSFECTCSCGCVSGNSSTVGRRGNELTDKLKLAVDSQQCLAFPCTRLALSNRHEGWSYTLLHQLSRSHQSRERRGVGTDVEIL